MFSAHVRRQSDESADGLAQLWKAPISISSMKSGEEYEKILVQTKPPSEEIGQLKSLIGEKDRALKIEKGLNEKL